MANKVSVLILTRNEEETLPDCLASVAWCDDIHVLDSFSTDRTSAIARSLGAQVTERTFDNYAAHRNFGLALPFRNPWVLSLDADERVAPELADEIQRITLSAAPQISAFRIPRRDYFLGTWLRHAQLSSLYLRLVRPERVRYTRAVNEVLEVDGQIGELEGPLLHFPFAKGIDAWVEKHNRYSTMEAELIVANTGLLQPSIRCALRNPDFHTRRLHQKALFYKLPARPLIKWLYMMLVRGALLDGPAGVAYSTLQAFYEYLIVLKTRELKDVRQRFDTPPANPHAQ